MSVEILNGNELIIQGALEAGFHLYTGYPGSPLADYFNILYERKQEFHQKGIRVAIANSEAHAAAMASGAKQANKNTLVAMKSMGLHVASDALSVGNFANPGQGGVVIVVGDDPWSLSTSSPADSRFLFKHLHIPFLDPSTPQELKDWMKVALEISLKTSVYQGLLLTTYMAEGGGRVELSVEKVLDPTLTTFNPETFDLGKNVMVPPNSLRADHTMINDRFPRVLGALKEMNLDKTYGNLESKIGIISSGAVFEVLKQVLDESDALWRFSLYKVAAPYPLVDELLLPFLSQLEVIIVVEEKRGFLETELCEFIVRHQLNCRVYGKKFVNGEEGFPIYGGLNYDIILEKLSKLFLQLQLGPCHTKSELIGESEVFKSQGLINLPRRLPTFCPGCPHRETLSLLKDLRGYLKNQNIDLISHGDVGCYSLSFLPPFKEMHNLSAMGQGGALGSGFDMFSKNPSIVLMGDSTFFHSGMTDISHSVQLGHNITYILLDNDNTAMTGHQMTPRTGVSVEGKTRPHQDMMHLVRALGVDEVIEVNPSDRYFYQNLLREMVLKKGTKVIISNKECGLTFHGRKKKAERKLFLENKTIAAQHFYQINTDACEDCRECVTMTGCPGLSQTMDAYGSKVMIDPQICVSDSYCTKIKACPSFEMVTVVDFHPTLYQKHHKNNTEMSLENLKKTLPDPHFQVTLDEISRGRDYRVVVTGVGGSGVTTISRVLAEAGRVMGGRSDIDFKFVDQKGLAQRNGNVTAHMALFQKGKSQGQVTPMGAADLLLSPDLLDGSQHINFLKNKSGLMILDLKFQIPLSIMLDRGEIAPTITEIDLQKKLKSVMSDKLKMHPMKDLSQKIFGKSVYSSAMILGVAFQEGTLPFTASEIEDAFLKTMKKEEFQLNLHAFYLGRKLSLDPDFGHSILNLEATSDEDVLGLFERSIKESTFFYNKNKWAQLFRNYLNEISSHLNGHFKIQTAFQIPKSHVAQYLHDVIVYGGEKYVGQFVADVKKLTNLYRDEALLKLALLTLAKTYFIKDEVMVAHLMISPMRDISDHKAYSGLGSAHKKTFINRPSFQIAKDKKWEFDFSPRPWMLRIMRHARFLRHCLPLWHAKEKDIAVKIRGKLLNNPLSFEELKKLELVKGYRQTRYAAFGHFFEGENKKAL